MHPQTRVPANTMTTAAPSDARSRVVDITKRVMSLISIAFSPPPSFSEWTVRVTNDKMSKTAILIRVIPTKELHEILCVARSPDLPPAQEVFPIVRAI